MTTWIGYTTTYREGGDKLARAAHTLARELRAQGAAVVCEAIESKREFVDALQRAGPLQALHFLGHSGLYGPMFRTRAMPEQFSPHEWRQLRIAFAPGAQAWFHACRSGRWFAPFFARTFGVTAWGHHLYTTFSRRPDRFAWDPPTSTASDPLYVVAMAGRKSHGVAASLGKYVGLTPLAPMLRFAPTPLTDDAGYDPVAALYDQAFADIGVRAPEIAWLDRHLPQHLGTVLDLGCGNGALLARFAGRMARGVGLDASPAMVERARSRQAHLPHLEFAVMREPVIPLADRSVDVVVSLLSWRYLDWDPLMAEIRRVLKPGGRLLIVDMAALPLQLRDLPAFVHDKAAQVWRHRQRPEFARDLGRLVADPRWAVMLQHNPIRADHEYRWYLQSRFPGGDVEILTVGGTSRVLAFDSGPLAPGWTAPQSYP